MIDDMEQLNEEFIREKLEEFREKVQEDNGDFQVLKIEDNIIYLKIKGRKNRKNCWDNIAFLVEYYVNSLKKEFKYKVSYEVWVNEKISKSFWELLRSGD